MSKHSEFVMESRMYGDRLANHVQIKCGACEAYEWVVAKDGGWAIRTFRQRGWKVGSKPRQHRCPSCMVTQRAAAHIPDNPVMPAELGAMLKTRIVQDHVKESLMSTAARHPRPTPRLVHVRVVPPAPTPPDIDGVAPEPVPEPAVAHPKSKRGQHAIPGVTVFTRRDNCARAATNATGSVDGLGFFTVPLGDGWTWKHAKDVSEDEAKAWLASRRYGTRIVRRGPTSKNGPAPEPVATITQVIARADGKHSLLTMPMNSPANRTPTEEEPAMAQAQPQEDTMPHPATDLPKPTRDDRSLIHDELTKRYDVVAQRYEDNDSDANVAGRLNMPRIWITEVRSMFFGDYDRNAANDIKVKELDAAIVMAKDATARLLAMAADAEALEVQLTTARKALR